MAKGRTVYSTGVGRLCPGCGHPAERCRCARPSEVPAGDGVGRVRRERAGRGGKTVTSISGLPLAPDALGELAARLKRLCGSGGTIRDGIVEIQGDHVDPVVEELVRLGHRAKRAGG